MEKERLSFLGVVDTTGGNDICRFTLWTVYGGCQYWTKILERDR